MGRYVEILRFGTALERLVSRVLAETFLKRAILIVTFSVFYLSACAVNNYGLIAAKVTEGDGAIVYQTLAPGLHVRTTAKDPGASLGYTKRTCILQKSTVSPAPGWYFLNIPEKSGACHAMDLSTIGIELRLGGVDMSLTIGGRFTTQMGNAAESDNTDIYLFFDSTNPASTILRLTEPRRTQ